MKHTIWSIAHTEPRGKGTWICVSDLGLLSYSNRKLVHLTDLNDHVGSLSARHVSVVYPDPVVSDETRLLLWVGTRTGVNKIMMSRNPFTTHLRGSNGLVLDRGAVISLCEDSKGILWVGLWGGGMEKLQRINGRYKRIAHYAHSPGVRSTLPHNDVGAIREDQNGVLWIGTPMGIMTLDRQRQHLASYRHSAGDSASLLSDRITSVYEDRSGTMWIGSVAGLSQHRGAGRFRHYLYDPADAHRLGRNEVSDILEDHMSNLWVATYGRGLNKLGASGTFTRFIEPADSLGTKENWIYSFAEDGNGYFWLSTGAGLVSFEPRSGEFSRHATDHLRNVIILDVFVDRIGDIWLSTTGGLLKYSPKTRNIVQYDEKDGVPFREFRSLFFRSAGGKLFVGSLDGFMEFFPDSVFVPSRRPEVVITSFSVFDKELPCSALSSGALRLSHDQNVLTFSFAALDYISPAQNIFAYTLDGVDKDWVAAGTRNYVVYANLEPGEYVFRVKGRSSEGTWNEDGTSLEIAITPPYWRTWWFRTLVAILVIVSVYSAYRYRLGRLLEVERLRLRIAHDLHDDVGSNLSAIAIASRTIQHSQKLTTEARHKLAEIYETAVLTQEGMKDLVWFIKPGKDTLDDLFVRMKETAASLLDDLEVEAKFPEAGDARKIPVDFKRSIFLAFKETLTNIVKHASASRVEINVGLRDGMLEMVIRDNGRGFDSNKVHRGTGLQSLRRRAETLGGSFEIAGQPNGGTKVRFTGKLQTG